MGFSHTAVLTDSGEVFTFGNGEFGQLGHETSGNIPAPKRVEFFANKGLKVTNINCGFNHTFAVTSDGRVWSWGFGGNESGLASFFGKKFGALGIAGLSFNRSIPTQIEHLSNFGKIRHISSGNNFAFAINEGNEVISWGDGQ